MKKLILLFCCSLFSTASTYAATESWQLALSKTDVEIYTREIEDSKFLQIKALVAISSSKENVLKFFQQNGKCWQWLNRCSSVTLLKKESNTVDVLYTIVDMPWPLADRDFLFQSSYQEDLANQVTRLTFSPASNIEKESGYVRAQSHAEYIIKAESKSSSTLTIVMHTEFGGSVSAKLINNKLVDELYNDIQRLIELTI